MTQEVNFADVPPLTLGWRLQLALDYGGVKQTELMGKFEVSRQTVSRWCNDVGVPPKHFILETIAAMCRVSPGWLIDGHTGAPPPPTTRLESKRRRKDDPAPGVSSIQPDGCIDNAPGQAAA